jgi:hypothetical protein
MSEHVTPENVGSHDTLGLLRSLIMLLETRGGFDCTAVDGFSWMRESGFAETQHLVGADTLFVGVE